MSRFYAEAHDDALWECFCIVLGAQNLATNTLARRIATLPGRLGGLGLRSATRSAPGAFWASWVNVLPILLDKSPTVATTVLDELRNARGATTSIIRDLRSAAWQLEQHAAEQLPTWAEAAAGAEPPNKVRDTDIDAADFDRGWQCHVCSYSEQYFLEHVVRPTCDDARRAMLLSQAGGPASAWLRAIPSDAAFTLSPLRFQVALRRRVRWPLPLSTGQCGKSCRCVLDGLGDHAASCPRSGRLKSRSVPLERIWKRILREAGARVRENVLLRDTGLPHIDPADGRKIEIVATGLPIEHGIPIAIDCTMVSPLHTDGSPWPHAATVPGI